MAEGCAQLFKFLHILKRSAIVAKHWWIGAKEGHRFGLVRIQRQPFQSRVGVESIELELEVVGSIGSEIVARLPLPHGPTYSRTCPSRL